MARRISIPVIVALLVAACGSSGTPTTTEAPAAQDAPSTTSSEAQLDDVDVLLPFGNPLSAYGFAIAEAFGYFQDEGLSVSMEVADGSAAVVQQVAAGNASVGGATPALAALAEVQGQRLVSFYNYSTRISFRLVTPESTGITSAQELEGLSIGVADPAGGENLYLSALLEQENINASVVEAGGSETAALAFDEGRIQAYISASNDIVPLMIIQEEKGDELRILDLGPYADFFDLSLMVQPDYLAANGQLLSRLGRAVAKGTLWTNTNPTGALALIQDDFPERVEDCSLALRSLEDSITTRDLTPLQEGKWGYMPDRIWLEMMDFLVQTGELSEAIDPTPLYTNDLNPMINDFSSDDVRADAEAFDRQPEC